MPETIIDRLTYSLGIDTKPLERDAKQAERGLGQFLRKVDTMFKATAGIVGGVFIGSQLAQWGRAAVSAATEMEQLMLGLRNVAGSAEAAEEQLARLREVAQLPGLGLEEAVQGSIRLQSVGVNAEMAERALMGVGNALASVGKGREELDGVLMALTQMVAKGQVYAEEILQIAERMPQIRRVMQSAFGTANTEAIQKMGLTAEQFIAGITAELEKLPRVAGGAANAFENLADSLFQAKANIGGLIMPGVVGFLDRVSGALDRFNQLFESSSSHIRRVTEGLRQLQEETERTSGSVRELLAEHEALTEQIHSGELSTDQLRDAQEKLHDVTQRILAIVPTAANEWDNYGKAIGFSRLEVERFLDAQDQMLRREFTRGIEDLAANYRSAAEEAKRLEQRTRGFTALELLQGIDAETLIEIVQRLRQGDRQMADLRESSDAVGKLLETWPEPIAGTVAGLLAHGAQVEKIRAEYNRMVREMSARRFREAQAWRQAEQDVIAYRTALQQVAEMSGLRALAAEYVTANQRLAELREQQSRWTEEQTAEAKRLSERQGKILGQAIQLGIADSATEARNQLEFLNEALQGVMRQAQRTSEKAGMQVEQSLTQLISGLQRQLKALENEYKAAGREMGTGFLREQQRILDDWLAANHLTLDDIVQATLSADAQRAKSAQAVLDLYYRIGQKLGESIEKPVASIQEKLERLNWSLAAVRLGFTGMVEQADVRNVAAHYAVLQRQINGVREKLQRVRRGEAIELPVDVQLSTKDEQAFLGEELQRLMGDLDRLLGQAVTLGLGASVDEVREKLEQVRTSFQETADQAEDAGEQLAATHRATFVQLASDLEQQLKALENSYVASGQTMGEAFYRDQKRTLDAWLLAHRVTLTDIVQMTTSADDQKARSAQGFLDRYARANERVRALDQARANEFVRRRREILAAELEALRSEEAEEQAIAEAEQKWRQRGQAEAKDLAEAARREAQKRLGARLKALEQERKAVERLRELEIEFLSAQTEQEIRSISERTRAYLASLPTQIRGLAQVQKAVSAVGRATEDAQNRLLRLKPGSELAELLHWATHFGEAMEEAGQKGEEAGQRSASAWQSLVGMIEGLAVATDQAARSTRDLREAYRTLGGEPGSELDNSLGLAGNFLDTLAGIATLDFSRAAKGIRGIYDWFADVDEQARYLAESTFADLGFGLSRILTDGMLQGLSPEEVKQHVREFVMQSLVQTAMETAIQNVPWVKERMKEFSEAIGEALREGSEQGVAISKDEEERLRKSLRDLEGVASLVDTLGPDLQAIFPELGDVGDKANVQLERQITTRIQTISQPTAEAMAQTLAMGNALLSSIKADTAQIALNTAYIADISERFDTLALPRAAETPGNPVRWLDEAERQRRQDLVSRRRARGRQI